MKAAFISKTRPTDDYVGLVYDVCTGTVQNDNITYAIDLLTNDEHRDTLQAFFLCSASMEQVNRALEIPIPVLEHVKKLVMDTSQFRNRLERFAYARDIVDDPDRLTARGREYVRTGMSKGPDILSKHFHLGDEEVDLDPKKLVRYFVETAYYLGANARGNSVTAETTKQARMWMLDTLKFMDAYKEACNTSSDVNEALIAIEERKNTTNISELGLTPDEIFH